MSLNLLGFASAGLSLAAFAGSYEWSRTKPTRVRLAASFLFTVLSIPSILSAVYYLHVLPEAAWFYTLRSWPGTELLGIFLGCAGGAVAWYLARYVRRQGYAPRFELRETFTPSLGLPALVGVRAGSLGHFIAVLEVNGNDVTFADPLNGEERLPMEKFKKRYQFTGFHMVIPKA